MCGVGVEVGRHRSPTYVYPEEVKMLMRAAFPLDICDYPDPCHDQVSLQTSSAQYGAAVVMLTSVSRLRNLC